MDWRQVRAVVEEGLFVSSAGQDTELLAKARVLLEFIRQHEPFALVYVTLEELTAANLRLAATAEQPVPPPRVPVARGPGNGHRQVVGPKSALERATRLPWHSRCHLDARLLPPHPKGLGASTPILSGAHQVPPRTEVAVDHGVG